MRQLSLTSRINGKREWTVYIFLLILMLAIVFRLIWLQAVQGPELKALGDERRTSDEKIIPQRGEILDSQGNVLAVSVPAKEIYADPQLLDGLIAKGQLKDSKESIAQKIAAILGVKQQDILAKLNAKAAWTSLAHQVDVPVAEKVMNLKIPGVGLTDEEKRTYPMDSFAAADLGFINQTGHGVEGIEAYYDKELYGKLGYLEQQNDSSQQPIASAPQEDRPAQGGNNLTLTINPDVQLLIEKELDQLAQTTKAKNEVILAMDPSTGKILGMGSRPTFDPNKYGDYPAQQWQNLALGMSYEPGSTFKVITGSAALEEGLITPDEVFPAPRFLKVGPLTIKNWDSDVTEYKQLSFTNAMDVSNNVVLAQVGLKLGVQNFYKFLNVFGFGKPTGVDIAGEQAGLLLPEDKVKDYNLATMSFGQTNLVTPLQLLTAISAVANGGTLYKPFIVDKITTPEGKLVQQNQPVAVRKVISSQTAAQMTKILENVVANGTGYQAQIPGINVAGKTGTAQKLDPKTGNYSPTDFIASFAAYAPAEKPEIALLVVLDTPQGESDGGVVAAPAAKVILQGALQALGVPVPAGTPNDIDSALAGAPVRPQPKPVVPERQPAEGETVVPDLTGLTMRQAGELLAKEELHFDFTGTGLASEQDPPAGKVVSKGSSVNVKFTSADSSP